MPLNLGDVILPLVDLATIHTQTGNLVIEDAEIVIDEDAGKVTVHIGATIVPPTGAVVLNAPAFAGMTGELVVRQA